MFLSSPANQANSEASEVSEVQKKTVTIGWRHVRRFFNRLLKVVMVNVCIYIYIYM